MSIRTWRLDPLEFVLLWEQLGRTALPYPIQYRASAAYAADHHRDRGRAATSIRGRLDDDLYRAIAILAEPEKYCAAYGLDGIGTSEEAVVRTHVGIRGNNATLARQHPGEAEDAGGPISIEIVSATTAPAKIAASLPRRREGKHDTIVAHPDELAHRPLLTDAGCKTSRERLAAVLKRPRRCAGEVTTCHATATTPTSGFAWHDFDDGRYLVEHAIDGHVTIRPGSFTAVATSIRAALNVEPQKEHP